MIPSNSSVRGLEANIGETNTNTEAISKLGKPSETNNQKIVPQAAKGLAVLGIGKKLSESPITKSREISDSPIAPSLNSLTIGVPKATIKETAPAPEMAIPELPQVTIAETAPASDVANSEVPLAGAVVPSPETSPTGTINFYDVPNSFWASNFIQPLAEVNIIEPASADNDKFEPNKPVTRAELATQIPQIFEEKSTRNAVNYDDIKTDSPAQAEIQRATQSGF